MILVQSVVVPRLYQYLRIHVVFTIIEALSTIEHRKL